MKISRKLNLTLGVSILSLMLALVIIVLWSCNAGGFSAVSIDTFVGVIVALLAIIVTVAIGWQIYAAMDLRSNIAKLDRRVKEVEMLRKRMEEQEKNMWQCYHESQHYNHIALGEIYQASQMYEESFRFYLKALEHDLQSAKPLNLKPIMIGMRLCSKSITENITLQVKVRDYIMETDAKIRELPLFYMIQDDYEEIFSLFKSVVKFQ